MKAYGLCHQPGFHCNYGNHNDNNSKKVMKNRVKSCIPKPLRPLQPLQPQRRQFDGNIIWVELCIPKPLEPLQPRHNGNSLMVTSHGLSHPFQNHQSYIRIKPWFNSERPFSHKRQLQQSDETHGSSHEFRNHSNHIYMTATATTWWKDSVKKDSSSWILSMM